MKVGDFITKKRLRARKYCAESIFVVEYLRKYESIFEIASANESGDPGVQFGERKKIGGRKSWETVPLIWYRYVPGTIMVPVLLYIN
jgi:hypothetical protein